MGEMLVVQSKVKEFLQKKAKGMRVSGDFAEALSKKVEELVVEASKRAKANGRNTIRPCDL